MLKLGLTMLVLASSLFNFNVSAFTVHSGFVYESTETAIDFIANGSDTVYLESIADSSKQKSFTSPNNRLEEVHGSFDLTFSEPGDYKYKIYNQDLSFDIVVSVYDTEDKNNPGLYSVFTAYKDQIKVEQVNFYKEYKLSVIVNAEGPGSAMGGGVYSHGTLVTLTATPDDNSLFAGWRLPDGTIITGSNIYDFIADASTYDSITITALFNPRPADVPATGFDSDNSTFFGIICVSAMTLCLGFYYARVIKNKEE